MVKHLPTMRETQVLSLGGEDTLEKEMATQSNTLAWKIPRMEEHDRLQSIGSQRVRHDQETSLSLSLSWIPQCSISHSLVAQTVKRLPAMRETRLWSLGWEDILEKEMANPLQYSCVENSMDGGVWWATVHGVTKSQTWLSYFKTQLITKKSNPLYLTIT